MDGYYKKKTYEVSKEIAALLSKKGDLHKQTIKECISYPIYYQLKEWYERHKQSAQLYVIRMTDNYVEVELSIL